MYNAVLSHSDATYVHGAFNIEFVDLWIFMMHTYGYYDRASAASERVLTYIH